MRVMTSAKEYAANALTAVLEAEEGERIVIFCDQEKRSIGEAFAYGAVGLGLNTRLVQLEEPETDRTDIPCRMKEVLSTYRTDIFINILRDNPRETPFRIKVVKLEKRQKVRLGHCPGISPDMLTEGALALDIDEYSSMQERAEMLLKHLQGVEMVRLTTPSGTDLTFSTLGRSFFTDTRVDWQTLKWMNLPVGEVPVAPVESSMNGRLVCDLAVGGIGQIDKPIEFLVQDGAVADVRGGDEHVMEEVGLALRIDDWSKVVGEFSFGLNPKARLNAPFLEAEKVGGTVHIAFGTNIDFPGGKNPSVNHMDFLMKAPTVDILRMGEWRRLMVDGNYNTDI